MRLPTTVRVVPIARHLLQFALIATATVAGAPISFPAYEQLATSPQQTHLLPGQKEFVFTMYGTPGDLEQLKQLVEVMKKEHLGNGFDPGPSARTASKSLFDYLASFRFPGVKFSIAGRRAGRADRRC